MASESVEESTAHDLMEMEVQQTIDGTTLTEYYSNPTNYSLVIKYAIVSCLEDINVTIEDITKFNVTGGSSSRRRSLKKKPSHISMDRGLTTEKSLASESFLVLDYIIETNMPGVTFDLVSEELETAVETGTFDTFLYKFAEVN